MNSRTPGVRASWAPEGPRNVATSEASWASAPRRGTRGIVLLFVSPPRRVGGRLRLKHAALPRREATLRPRFHVHERSGLTVLLCALHRRHLTARRGVQAVIKLPRTGAGQPRTRRPVCQGVDCSATRPNRGPPAPVAGFFYCPASPTQGFILHGTHSGLRANSSESCRNASSLYRVCRARPRRSCRM